MALFVPEGAYRVCVAEVESVQPLSFRRGLGYREKLALGASGRAILAHMDSAAVEALDVHVDPTELAPIRERGYAVSRNELIEGAVALAAPFFNGADRVAGSLCIFGPGVRMTETACRHSPNGWWPKRPRFPRRLGTESNRPGFQGGQLVKVESAPTVSLASCRE